MFLMVSSSDIEEYRLRQTCISVENYVAGWLPNCPEKVTCLCFRWEPEQTGKILAEIYQCRLLREITRPIPSMAKLLAL